jgi:hypothetical protein
MMANGSGSAMTGEAFGRGGRARQSNKITVPNFTNADRPKNFLLRGPFER